MFAVVTVPMREDTEPVNGGVCLRDIADSVPIVVAHPVVVAVPDSGEPYPLLHLSSGLCYHHYQLLAVQNLGLLEGFGRVDLLAFGE